jgi:hypothetical protein
LPGKGNASLRKCLSHAGVAIGAAQGLAGKLARRAEHSIGPRIQTRMRRIGWLPIVLRLQRAQRE